jgi:hypothetical protein
LCHLCSKPGLAFPSRAFPSLLHFSSIFNLSVMPRSNRIYRFRCLFLFLAVVSRFHFFLLFDFCFSFLNIWIDLLSVSVPRFLICWI